MKLVDDWIKQREAHVGVVTTHGAVLVGCACAACVATLAAQRRVSKPTNGAGYNEAQGEVQCQPEVKSKRFTQP